MNSTESEKVNKKVSEWKKWVWKSELTRVKKWLNNVSENSEWNSELKEKMKKKTIEKS